MYLILDVQVDTFSISWNESSSYSASTGTGTYTTDWPYGYTGSWPNAQRNSPNWTYSVFVPELNRSYAVPLYVIDPVTQLPVVPAAGWSYGLVFDLTDVISSFADGSSAYSASYNQTFARPTITYRFVEDAAVQALGLQSGYTVEGPFVGQGFQTINYPPGTTPESDSFSYELIGATVLANYSVVAGHFTPALTVSISDAAADEDAGQLTFTISLSQAFESGTLTIAPIINSLNGQPAVLKYSNANDLTQDIQGPNLFSVTFNPGETTKTLTLPVHVDALAEPDEVFSFKIGVSTNTTGSQVSFRHDTAVGTILNDDGDPASVVLFFPNGGFDTELVDLLRQDIQAAVARVENALGSNQIPDLEIAVVSKTLTGTTLAQARPVFSQAIESTNGTVIEFPNAVYEKLFSDDPNGSSPDIIVSLDPEKVRTFYSGKSDVDVTTLLTHEILHGLGFGAETSQAGHFVPWELMTADKEYFRGTQVDDAMVKLYPDPDDPVGHLEAFGALMSPGTFGPNTPISDIEISILRDLGFGTFSPQWLPLVGTYKVIAGADSISRAKLVDGYISDATVFSDSDGNGLLDPTEASTTTDATGGFSLSDGTGPLVAFGGSDTSTGLAFKGQLSAPAGSSVITPLTTLMALLSSDAQAEQKVLASFALSSSIDLNSFDPIAATLVRSADGAATMAAVAKVYDTVSLIASTLVAAGGGFSDGVKEAFATIAAAIGGSGVSLTNEGQVSALVTAAAQAEGLTLGQGVADSVAAIIVATNTHLDQQAQSGATGTELLNAIAAIERVVQGTASNAIQQAGNDPDQLQILVEAFTGENLDEAVSTALEHLGTADTTAPTLTPVADQTFEAASALGAAAFFTATASDDLDGALPVVFKEGSTVVQSGDMFSFGTHTITATAVDAAGNQTSQNFVFNVVDTTAPTLTPVADQTLQATTAAGVAAFFSTTATDLVDGANPVVFTEGDRVVRSGDIFGVGAHTITATAIDAAGNSSTDVFEINVLGLASNNHDPIAIDDSKGVAKGESLSVSANKGVLANDRDADHDHLSVGSVNGSAANVGHSIKGEYGTLKLNADGSYSYLATTKALPSKIFAQDTFTYTTVDGHGGSDTATLTFSVYDPSYTYKAGSHTILWGDNGKNVLDGSAGRDILYGGNGADVLIGGKGDILAGGKGADHFVFRADFGANTILDFDVKNDRLQFDDTTFNSIKSILDHTTNTALGVLISDGHGDSVLLLGVSKSQLLAHGSDLLIS